METLRRYDVVAHNTATSSANKIHDDTVARRYGFGGGLVPGVDVYAYMTHPPAEAWGLDWLERGWMRARFLAPVYEGQAVSVVPGEPVRSAAGLAVPIEVVNSEGTVCARGEAGLPGEAVEPPPADTWAAVAPAEDPPPASPASLAAGTALGLEPRRFHAARAGEYLDDVREDLALYRDAQVAHPGWLLRDANRVLSANVRLGPWIHVASEVQHHGRVRDGDAVGARATVVREWERKGHRFVELDVGLLGDGRAVARVTHTAIYRPRPAPPA